MEYVRPKLFYSFTYLCRVFNFTKGDASFVWDVRFGNGDDRNIIVVFQSLYLRPYIRL